MIDSDKNKVYYTIGEVAEMFGLNVSTVRYWDNCFQVLKLDRTKKGNRLFRPQDVEKFRIIHHLIKEKGMTIKGAELYLKKSDLSHAERDVKIIEKLEGIKSLLNEVLLRIKEEGRESNIIYEES